MHDHALECWKQRALALDSVDAHRSFTAGNVYPMCTRQGSCVAACVEQVDDPHIAFTDSRTRELLGRVPTWQGPRTTGARPLTHQGPDRGTYRRAPLRRERRQALALADGPGQR